MPTMIIDDINLIYTGRWSIGGTPSEYKSTTHGTNEAGASASFTFLGTSVSVYGTIAVNAKHAVSTYSVDGSHAVSFTADPMKIVQYRQLFYQVSNLPYGQHHLVITNMNDRAQFWLDYLVVGVTIGNTRASSTLALSTQSVIESPSNAPITVSSTTSILHSSFESTVTLPSSIVTSFAGSPASVTNSPVLTPTSLPTSLPKLASNSDIIITVTRNSTPSLQITIINPSPSAVSLVLPSSTASFGNYAPPNSNSSIQATSASSHNHAGVIAGSVIATIVCIALAVVAFLWIRRRRVMRAPSRQAPKTPDPNWFKGHSFQWPDKKGQIGQP